VVVHVIVGFTTPAIPVVGETAMVTTGTGVPALTTTVAVTRPLAPPALEHVIVYEYVLTVVRMPID